jgi:hypothetical protein
MNKATWTSTLTQASFVAFLCYCFESLGPSAIRYLSVLAMLICWNSDNTQQSAINRDLDYSERAQYHGRIALLGLLLL